MRNRKDLCSGNGRNGLIFGYNELDLYGNIYTNKELFNDYTLDVFKSDDDKIKIIVKTDVFTKDEDTFKNVELNLN